jgi:hypothetical protein
MTLRTQPSPAIAVEPGDAPSRLRSAAQSFIASHIWTLILVIGSVSLGLLINTYRFGIWDHAVYVPVVERLAHPDLFRSDYLFRVPLGDYAFWCPAVAALIRTFPVEWVFFVGHILAELLLFWAIFRLSMTLFGNRAAAGLAVLLLLVPKWIGGTTNFTHDIYFVARDAAIPLALATLIPYYRGKLTLAGFLAGIVFLLHPVTGFAVISIVLFSALLDARRYGAATTARTFGIVFLVIIPLLATALRSQSLAGSHGGFLHRTSPAWLQIIKTRLPCLFLSTWTPLESLSLAAYFVILIAGVVLSWRWSNDRMGASAPRSHVATARLVLMCASMLVAGVAFVEWYPLPLLVELNLTRCLYLVIDLALIYAAWAICEGSVRARRAFSRGEQIGMARNAARLILSSLIPLFLVSVLVSGEQHRVIVGAPVFLWWIIAIVLVEGTDAASLVSVLWLSVGAVGIGAALIAIHRVGMFGVHGVLGAPLSISILLGALLLEFRARRLKSEAIHPWYKSSARLVTIAWIIFVISNGGILVRALGSNRLPERVDLPGRPSRHKWDVANDVLSQDWIDVGSWARTKTDVGSVFFVPPDVYGGFRALSQRSIVVDWQDGTLSVYSEPFALEWWGRMAELQGYASFDATRFTALAKKYDANFVVTRHAQRLPLHPVFETSSLTVYAIPVPQRGVSPNDDGQPGETHPRRAHPQRANFRANPG